MSNDNLFIVLDTLIILMIVATASILLKIEKNTRKDDKKDGK